MTEVYVIRNQHRHYWGKSKAWVSGSDAKVVMRAKHEDDAVNTLFELSAKDVDLRGEVLAATLSERGEPVIEPSQIPLLSADEATDESTIVPREPDADTTVEIPQAQSQETH